MNFELAKKLKDAGFPQDKINTSRNGDGVSYLDSGMERGHERDISASDYYKLQDRCYVPTLSELIEACGEEFMKLQRHDSGMWFVFSSDHGILLPWSSTPEEAVANLWLKLNE